MLYSEFRNLPKAREKVYPMPIQRRFMKPTPVDPQAPAIAGDRLFDVKKAATYLGVGRETIRKMVHDRQIPYVHLGKGFKIDRLDLDRWIEKRKIPAVA